MYDFIEMAPYFRNTNFVYESTLITEFTHVCGINDIKHIDMNLLRMYYRSNKEKCINLIDELALRGFTFHTKRITNILPSKVYEIDNDCIFVRKNGEQFKKIDFLGLGLANFIERFKVNSDYFFQYIKLDNFLHINRTISLEVLKREFLKCGFNFVNSEEFILESCNVKLNNNYNNDKSNSETEHDIVSAKEDIFFTKQSMLLLLEDVAKRSPIEGVRIYDIYGESGFHKFRNFCDFYGLTYMEQLKEIPLKELVFFEGFGKEKVKRVVERYDEYVKHSAEQMDFYYIKNSMDEFLENIDLSAHSSGVQIKNVFIENGFNMFRTFCDEHKIIYIDQLKNFPFDELAKIRGFGKVKVDSIKNRYEDYINNSFVPHTSMEVSEDLSNIGINNFYLDVEIEGLKAINIDESLIQEFKNRDIRYIKDLLKLKYSKLVSIRNVGKKKINRFITNIRLLNQPPEELLKFVLRTIRENDNFEVFRARSIGKVTLQQLGERYDITRERIRQKEKKIFIIFEGFFVLFNKLIFGKDNKAIINVDDIRDICTDDEDILHIKYALINEAYPAAVYFKELDKFLINKNLEKIKLKLDSIIEENFEEIFNFYDEIVNIDEMLKEAELEFIDIEDFLTYAKERGFNECGNYLVYRGVSLRKMYSYILREYFPEGVKYSDPKDIEAVLKIAREDFHLERHTEEDVRALSAIISENVLCDRGKYIHPDYIDIPVALVERIKDYILEQPDETLIIADIYQRFENELSEQSNVDNRYFLHGVLRHYYGDEFIFVRDKISKSQGKIMSTNKILENFLMEQGCPVTKDRIREQFPGWTEAMLQNADIVNKNIINWDKGRMTCMELLEITESDKEMFKGAIEAALTDYNGYCNAKVIYKKLRLKMNSFYKKNGITSYASLFYVLKNLFEDTYYFRMPHILREKQDKQFTAMDVILKTVEEKQVVTYEEISDYLINKLKMNESTMYAARRKLMDKFIEIRKGEYILKDNISLDEESINKIREFIEAQLSGKEYVPMLSIIDFRGMPDIGYDWNPLLLQDIIEDNMLEYRFIEKEFKDRRYRCSSIVRRTSKLNNIVELIIYALENEYKDKENMTVQAIQQYLSLKNIILNSLPYEFLSSERVSIDEFHRVEIL